MSTSTSVTVADMQTVQAILTKDLEGINKVKAELEAFVSGSLTTILEETIKKLLDGKEHTQMVGGIVKTLLVTKGKDHMILSIDIVERQGHMKSVEDLIEDQNGYYRSCINLYGIFLSLLVVAVVVVIVLLLVYYNS